MFMKKIAFFILIMILGVNMSIAQNRRGNFDPKDMAKRQTSELKERLGLDKAQEEKVYQLNLAAANTMVTMRKEMQAGGDRDAMRSKMKEMRDKNNAEMKKVLTDSQYKDYMKYQEERRKQRQGGGGNSRR